jgi:poly(glycerol-phosphate) alpha-glucosyltransferase
MSAAPLAGRTIGLLTSSASRLNGGVFEAVVAQAEMVRMQGGEAIVFALRDEQSEADRARFGPSEVRLFDVLGPRQVGYSPALPPALLAADLDVLHIQGIWMYPSRAGAVWARRTGRPYYVTPQGMLDPWILRRGRWKKAIARIGYERASWRAARRLHALTMREAGQIAAATGRTDSVVMPNPAPPLGPPLTAPRAPHMIYIGRIHSKKNVIALVEAWILAKLPDGARLTIAGWGDPDDVAELQAAVATAPGVEFVGSVFGEAKAALLASARFMILPSHSEGLPLALLESWARGVPTIHTAECNIAEGFAAGAAIECGYSPDEIAAAIEAALALDEPRWREMSAAAQGLAGGPFSLATLARGWGEIYLEGIAATQP